MDARNEELGFLDALAARPDDDVTWQIYGDWLEERGDPRSAFVRLVFAIGQGEVEAPELYSTVKRLTAMCADLPESWSSHVLDLWANRPLRLRIVTLQILGNIPPREMFDRAMTLLHCLLESGTIRIGDAVLVPLEDGCTRQERVTSLSTFQRADYQLIRFGQEPLGFGLMWRGHRLGVQKGGLIVSA